MQSPKRIGVTIREQSVRSQEGSLVHVAQGWADPWSADLTQVLESVGEGDVTCLSDLSMLDIRAWPLGCGEAKKVLSAPMWLAGRNGARAGSVQSVGQGQLGAVLQAESACAQGERDKAGWSLP